MNNKRMLIYRRVTVLVISFIMSMSVICCLNPAWGYADEGKSEVTWIAVPDISADTAVLIDADTGEVLYEKNAYEKRYPASITKICTALLTIENCNLDDTMTFEGEALTPLPSGYVSIQPSDGEQMSVRDCMYGLLMQSANDAGNGLAVYEAGSIAAFADLMNERAKKAGAKDTHFANPSGLYEEDHYTTAYDMAMIMRQCVKYDDFITIASATSYTIPATNKHAERKLESHVQPLLKSSPYYMSNVICGKTGFTTPSGMTMVTCAEQDNRRLICVVMKCSSEAERCESTKQLYEYGFSYKTVKASDQQWDNYKFESDDEGLSALMKNRKFIRSLVSCDDVMIPVDGSLEDLDVEVTDVSTEECGKDDIAKGSLTVTLQFSHEDMKLGTAVFRYTPDTLIQKIADKTAYKGSIQVLTYCFYAIIALGILIIVALIAFIILHRRKKVLAENGGAAVASEHRYTSEDVIETMNQENEKIDQILEEVLVPGENEKDISSAEDNLNAETNEDHSQDISEEAAGNITEQTEKNEASVTDISNQESDIDTVSETEQDEESAQESEPADTEEAVKGSEAGAQEEAGKAAEAAAREEAGKAAEPTAPEEAGKAAEPAALEKAGKAAEPGIVQDTVQNINLTVSENENQQADADDPDETD